MKEYKNNDLLLVMGVNAKAGLEKAAHMIGSHRLGVVNERSHIHQEWCYENGFCIMNTWFPKTDDPLDVKISRWHHKELILY